MWKCGKFLLLLEKWMTRHIEAQEEELHRFRLRIVKLALLLDKFGHLQLTLERFLNRLFVGFERVEKPSEK